MNRTSGRPVPVSAETRMLVLRAIEAWRITGAMFDPTVHGAVIAAGYDRSFEVLARNVDATPQLAVFGRPSVTDIVIDGDTVRLPSGAGFDPGGIGKGLAADIVAGEILAAGADGVCINLGGDLRVLGLGPDDGAWTVSIDHPWTDAPVALVGLAGGAVASSTTLLRTWAVDGIPQHHLIDPETGLPSTTDLNFASVITGQAWMAEVLTKAVLLRGNERAFDLIDTKIAQALTVDRSGVVRTTPGFAAYLGLAPLPIDIEVPTMKETER